MNSIDFDRIQHKVDEVISDRKKGSFKRAFWYGGRTEGIKGVGNVIKALPNIIIGNMGKGKGMRKVIRNGPKNILQLIGRLAGNGLAFAFPAASAAMPVGAAAAGAVFTQIGQSAAVSVTQLMTWVLTKNAVKISHSGANYFRDRFGKKKHQSPEIEEAIRKQIKRQVKQLEKEDALLLIDRNLVKMKDAHKKVEPAVKNLMMVLSNKQASEEEKFMAMENALRTSAEAVYYVDKVERLVNDLIESLTTLDGSVEELDRNILQIQAHLKEYILQAVDVKVDRYLKDLPEINSADAIA